MAYNPIFRPEERSRIRTMIYLFQVLFPNEGIPLTPLDPDISATKQMDLPESSRGYPDTRGFRSGLSIDECLSVYGRRPRRDPRKTYMEHACIHPQATALAGIEERWS